MSTSVVPLQIARQSDAAHWCYADQITTVSFEILLANTWLTGHARWCAVRIHEVISP
jgi:hypothetical protein